MPPATQSPATATLQSELQMLVFTVSGEEFAFPLMDVREIIKAMPVTDVPSTPHFLKGILNLRGTVVSVADAGELLGLPATENAKQHIIIADDTKTGTVGLLVETVTGVVRAPASSLKKAPELLSAKEAAASVKGAVIVGQGGGEVAERRDRHDTANKDDARLILLLDLPCVIARMSHP